VRKTFDSVLTSLDMEDAYIVNTNAGCGQDWLCLVLAKKIEVDEIGRCRKLMYAYSMYSD
jgi:hypothetical protein